MRLFHLLCFLNSMLYYIFIEEDIMSLAAELILSDIYKILRDRYQDKHCYNFTYNVNLDFNGSITLSTTMCGSAETFVDLYVKHQENASIVNNILTTVAEEIGNKYQELGIGNQCCTISKPFCMNLDDFLSESGYFSSYFKVKQLTSMVTFYTT